MKIHEKNINLVGQRYSNKQKYVKKLQNITQFTVEY
jgi:hypothetical protein